jgi:hypothetical protein
VEGASASASIVVEEEVWGCDGDGGELPEGVGGGEGRMWGRVLTVCEDIGCGEGEVIVEGEVVGRGCRGLRVFYTGTL